MLVLAFVPRPDWSAFFDSPEELFIAPRFRELLPPLLCVRAVAYCRSAFRRWMELEQRGVEMFVGP